MKLISDTYLRQQGFLHFDDKYHRKYGTGGPGDAELIEKLCQKYACKSILDYGCGKGLLRDALPMHDIKLYDPSVPEFSNEPSAADLVTCLDVMEHVEELYLDDVIRHLRSLTNKILLIIVSLRYAGRWLPDGRNAHLIVKPAEWWRVRFERKKFSVVEDLSGKRKLEWKALLK